MKRRSVFAIAIGSLIAGVVVDPALAGLVTWEFTGEVTSVFDRNNLLGGAITVGSPFSGSFTFESTTKPTEPGGGFYGDAITDISGQVVDLPFHGPISSIDFNFLLVEDNIPHSGDDQYLVRTAAEFLDETVAFGLSLIDTSGTVFSNRILPLSPPALELFTSTEFKLSPVSESFLVVGEVTSIVPEPMSLILLGVGVLMTERWRRKRYATSKVETHSRWRNIQ